MPALSVSIARLACGHGYDVVSLLPPGALVANAMDLLQQLNCHVATFGNWETAVWQRGNISLDGDMWRLTSPTFLWRHCNFLSEQLVPAKTCEGLAESLWPALGINVVRWQSAEHRKWVSEPVSAETSSLSELWTSLVSLEGHVRVQLVLGMNNWATPQLGHLTKRYVPQGITDVTGAIYADHATAKSALIPEVDQVPPAICRHLDRGSSSGCERCGGRI